ncbi:hypothetical protein DO97_04270 [Neosynechococcus sphagnicola sy1]|uniref:Methyltransferase FkbM domain-containing protein n=1 Tax=Neosynechococcus sphagnicola sy1 TaxID=1497020 RepID=A0A098TQ14_9CYAN|nr:hypothetical protein [Neosynechococcus sphagnicola]KGF72918.1 hypothetical protein DO97_04270 [Neosynechococcus sphagnicola sy1]
MTEQYSNSQGINSQGIVWVGAGDGRQIERLWNSKRPLWVLEADSVLSERLKERFKDDPQVHVTTQLVTEVSGDATFYCYNNSRENGLLPLNLSQAFCPNIRLLSEQKLQGQSLAFLLEDTEVHYADLVIDCRPALPILRGAGGILSQFEQVQVILCRAGEQDESEAVMQLLQQFALELSSTQETAHPALAIFSFKRDRLAWSELHRHHLAQQLAASEQVASDRLTQVETLSHEIAQITASLTEQKNQVEQLRQARDEQTRLAQDRLTQIASLSQGKAELETRLSESITQLEILRQVKGELEQSLAAQQTQIEKLTQAQAKPRSILGRLKLFLG